MFVYLETMFGSHRSWLARYTGPLLVFLSEMGSCLSWSISLLFPKQLHAALILVYISSLVVSLRCGVCPRYLNSVTVSSGNNNNRTQRRNSRFFTISSLRREPSACNTYAKVARAQSCANHRTLITCNMSCFVPRGTKGQLSY